MKVTVSPTSDGLGDAVSTVAEAARLTTWVTVPELSARVAVPEYAAVIGCEPTVSAAVDRVATPSPSPRPA